MNLQKRRSAYIEIRYVHLRIEPGMLLLLVNCRQNNRPIGLRIQCVDHSTCYASFIITSVADHLSTAE
jgi:hypothetical protein